MSEEKRDNQQQVIYTYAYSYDGVGNRESMTHDGAGTSYFYDDKEIIRGTHTLIPDNSGDTHLNSGGGNHDLRV